MINKIKWLTAFHKYMSDAFPIHTWNTPAVDAFALDAHKARLSPGQAAGLLISITQTLLSLDSHLSIPGCDLDAIKLQIAGHAFDALTKPAH